MNIKNFFYREYYEGFDPRQPEEEKVMEKIEAKNEAHFIKRNKQLLVFEPSDKLLAYFLPTDAVWGPDFRKINLTTTYPGLFSGSGYTHETGSVGELKLGFSFDHTSGLPILPGHSVKGVLRSVFPRRKVLMTTESKAIKNAKAQYILDLLKATGPVPAKENENQWVDALEQCIFEGINPSWDGKDPKLKYLAMPARDGFLDAMISDVGKDRHILGVDAITPHKDNPLKNPIPLPFLKVLPAVQWQFSFVLHTTTIDGIVVDANRKKLLFEAILLDVGAGAKTNVGYGQFTRQGNVNQAPPTGQGEETKNKPHTDPPPRQSTPNAKPLAKWKPGDPQLIGRVEKIDTAKEEVYFSTELISDFTGVLVAKVSVGVRDKLEIGRKYKLSLIKNRPEPTGELIVRVQGLIPIP